MTENSWLLLKLFTLVFLCSFLGTFTAAALFRIGFGDQRRGLPDERR